MSLGTMLKGGRITVSTLDLQGVCVRVYLFNGMFKFVSVCMIEYSVCMTTQRCYSFSWLYVFPAACVSDSVTRYCILADLGESC